MRSSRVITRPVTKLAAVVGTSHGECKRPSVTPKPDLTTRLGNAESLERFAIVHREALEQLNNFSIDSSTTANNDINSAHPGDDTPASHHVNLLGEPVLHNEEVVAACYVGDEELDLNIDNFWSDAFLEHFLDALPLPQPPLSPCQC